MINLYDRMSPDPAGIDTATSWSSVGRASDWITEAGYGGEDLVQQKAYLLSNDVFTWNAWWDK